jgi:hypothetical protein
VNQAILAWSVKILSSGKSYEPTKPILLDSHHITGTVYSESSNIGLVGKNNLCHQKLTADQVNIA